MTREDIIRMAQEAGLHIATDVNWMPIIGLEYAQKFAALVAAAAIKEAPDYKMGFADGVVAEREACAKVVEQTPFSNWFQSDCAAAIRARSNT